MIYRRIRISGTDGPADPLTLEHGPGPLRTPGDLMPLLREAQHAQERLVILTGHRPGTSLYLPALVKHAAEHDLKVAVEGLADHLDPAALHAAGVEVVVLPLLGHRTAHDALLGPGAHARLMAFLHAPLRPRVRLRCLLRPDTVRALPKGLAEVAAHLEHVTLEAAPLADRAVLGVPELLDGVWQALRQHEVAVSLDGLCAAPDLSPGEPRPLDALLLSLRAQGGWLPGLGGGVTAPAGDATDARLLHALGMPLHRPVPLTDPAPPPEGPTAVVVPHLGDGLLATVTLPALAGALNALGRATTLLSVWERPWNLEAPADLPPAGSLDARMGGEAAGRRQELAKRFVDRFLQRLDLSTYGHVVVAGWQAAHAVHTHPTLRPDAVVEVIDLHLLDGFDAWTGVSGWPHGRVRVVSCFPSFAAAYLRRGVPMTALRFRPYPMAAGFLPPAQEGSVWLAAGNHRRDHDLLARAVRDRRAEDAVDVITAHPVPDVPGLRAQPPVQLPALVQAVARCRGVVLPVRPHPHDAAGISLAAFALALGKPVVGTTAWGLYDHIPHEVAGLLVDATDDLALGRALRTLDTDADQRRRLADGALQAGACADVHTLAAVLLGQPHPAWPARP